MRARDLMATARGLMELDPRLPTQANQRRALSTAYYAVFHALARSAADLLIGRKRTAAWHQAYRALEHGHAKRACQNKRAMEGFPSEILEFAGTFVVLQDARHQADYSLEVSCERNGTLAAIDRAEQAIGQLEGANIEHRRDFVAYTLFKRLLP